MMVYYGELDCDLTDRVMGIDNDYRIHMKHNEKAKSLTIENFTLDQCKSLYRKHTAKTGQAFEDAIDDKLWSDTKGQSWLVNALAQK